MYFCSSSGCIELNITKVEANIGFHSGQCDNDILLLRKVPRLRRQLDKLDPELVCNELRSIGEWDEEELKDHDQNLNRLLWLACANIVEVDSSNCYNYAFD